MGRNSLFCDPMHLLGPYLKFDMLSLRSYDGRMQGLIEVGLWNRDVILESPRQRSPQRMNNAQPRVATHFCVGNDAERGEIVDLLE